MELGRVKKKIRPNEKEIWRKVNKFVGKVNRLLKKKNIDAMAEVGGSLAKGTLLKGDHDVDIFVKFSKRYASQKLSDHLERTLASLKPERVHGSRDYFRIKFEGIQYEIVPVYNIISRKEIVNITDASPLHVAWVNLQTGEKEGLKDEIRLAKQFCKAQEVYGAESYIRGFSGHVLDIITIYYRSFENLVKNAARWKKKQVIDFYNVYKGDALKKLNRSKTQSPLIVIDPVQPDRNASAALDEEMFDKFLNASKEFVKKPSERFFEKQKFALKGVKGKNTIVLSVAPLEGKRDVVGSKLLKAHENIRKHLELNGFEIEESGWHWDKKAYFWYKFKKMKINKEFVHEGPPKKAKRNFREFAEKYPGYFVKNKRAYVKLRRKHTEANEMIKALLKKEFISNKFKSARMI